AHLFQQGRICQTIPDEVETPMPRPQIIVEAGDGIANHLLPRWQKEGEVRKQLIQRPQRQICFVRRATPDVIASIVRLYFGQDRRAHGGANTVAPNKDCALFNPPTGEMNANTRTILLDALKVPTEMVMGWVDGIAQQPLQPIPRC